MNKRELGWVIIIIMLIVLASILIILITNKQGIECISNPFLYTEKINKVNLVCKVYTAYNSSYIDNLSSQVIIPSPPALAP